MLNQTLNYTKKQDTKKKKEEEKKEEEMWQGVGGGWRARSTLPDNWDFLQIRTNNVW